MYAVTNRIANFVSLRVFRTKSFCDALIGAIQISAVVVL